MEPAPDADEEDIIHPEQEDITINNDELEKMDFVDIPRVNSAATDPHTGVGGIADPDQTPSCSEKADLFDSSQIFVGDNVDIEK